MAAVTLRRKNNDPKRLYSGSLALRQSIKPISFPSDGISGGAVAVAVANSAPIPQGGAMSIYLSPRHEIENSMHYNHPKNVHQWVVSSANESVQATGGVSHGLPIVDHVVDNGFESTSNSHRLAFNDDFESYVSMLDYPSGSQSFMSQAIPDVFCDLRTMSSPDATTGEAYLESTFVDDRQCTGGYLNSDSWPAVEDTYTGSLFATEVTCAAPAAPIQDMGLNDWETSHSHSAWPQAQPCSEEPPPYCPLLYTGDRTWSNRYAATMDPSVSSSYSQGDYLLQYDGSSVSNTNLEESNSIVGQVYTASPRTLDPSSHFTYATSAVESSMDGLSAVRPPRPSHRQPLPSSTFSSRQDSGTYRSVMANSYDEAIMRRNSSCEGENKNIARCNVLYQAKVHSDGLYHCPFEGEENCDHPPDKLKCNYDKHLDSHLKPYKCKVLACDKVPFSSTACLLRHEREAHGMHGHGEKPYLCKYEDCDRSIDGNGFPRRWNLQDHMKRVHNDVGPCSTGSASPSDSSASSPRPPNVTVPVRKKRNSDNPQSAPMKRNKSSTTATKVVSKASKDQSTLTTKRSQSQAVQKQWQVRQPILRDSFAGLDSSGSFAYPQLSAECAMLNDTGVTFPFFDTEPFSTGY